VLTLDTGAIEAVARRAGQAVLDELAERLMDLPQDELVAGTAAVILRVISEAAKPWAHTWDI
jgi:hypothetical protein